MFLWRQEACSSKASLWSSQYDDTTVSVCVWCFSWLAYTCETTCWFLACVQLEPDLVVRAHFNVWWWPSQSPSTWSHCKMNGSNTSLLTGSYSSALYIPSMSSSWGTWLWCGSSLCSIGLVFPKAGHWSVFCALVEVKLCIEEVGWLSLACNA